MKKHGTLGARALAGLFLALFGAGGCSEGKHEARALVEAVDAYRRAENSGKAERARAIERTTCSNADVCAARDACLASSRATVRGLDRKKEVEDALAGLHVDGGNAPPFTPARSAELAALLDEASHEMDVGFDALAICDQRVVDLRLKFAL